MKVRFLSNIRASLTRLYRKFVSVIKLRFLRNHKFVAFNNNYAGRSFIGLANVLEVFVPYLQLEKDTKLFQTDMLEPGLFSELGFWMDELKTVHQANELLFKVAEGFLPQTGWDDVTGMRGRVVAVEIWGVLNHSSEINTRISDMVVNLGEAYEFSPVSYGKKTLKRIDQVEKLEIETRNKIRELMLERSNKIGNVEIRREL